MASRFRDDLFDCLTVRGDELFELADALLCADGPVGAPVDLALVAEHRHGHGAMYDALSNGNADVPRLRQVLASLPMPHAADRRKGRQHAADPFVLQDLYEAALHR